MSHAKSYNPTATDLSQYGIHDATAQWNLSPEKLTEHTLQKGQGKLTHNDTLVVNTGEFTGRSPKDRFIVKDDTTADTVDWNDINLPFEPTHFERLKHKITDYLSGKEVYVRDAFAGAHPDYRLSLRLITEYPWSNMFGYNMFLRPTDEELEQFSPEWTILCAPGLMADPETDGTRQHNFAVINFSEKTIIIGGTGYTGEIKKGIFSVLNYVLPTQHKVLAMHCSANQGKDGDTAIFFGLSGTGKTTLSADPERALIGDDEHGWSDDSVFNFEGGCYAKTIDLSADKEPEIFAAIKPGAILENIGFEADGKTPDYEDSSITQNTRVSYPITHIDNRLDPSRGNLPKNIFFLTCDAFGVLPPISKLTKEQAMYHFVSGYTAKVAGTEAGIKEPKTVFSACFGAPFLPLHPVQYASMLGKRMEEHNVNVWLINTGWSGGSYGDSDRISLKHTRAMITAALEGRLDDVEYRTDEVFGLHIPQEVPGVPSDILNPRDAWTDKDAYDVKVNDLAQRFVTNFTKYADRANAGTMAAAPKVRVKA